MIESILFILKLMGQIVLAIGTGIINGLIENPQIIGLLILSCVSGLIFRKARRH